MVQSISQEEIRRNIISDMVRKRNPIVPVISEDTIVYKVKVTKDKVIKKYNNRHDTAPRHI